MAPTGRATRKSAPAVDDPDRTRPTSPTQLRAVRRVGDECDRPQRRAHRAMQVWARRRRWRPCRHCEARLACLVQSSWRAAIDRGRDCPLTPEAVISIAQRLAREGEGARSGAHDRSHSKAAVLADRGLAAARRGRKRARYRWEYRGRCVLISTEPGSESRFRLVPSGGVEG
jgi:hypothetical protein